uniref:X-box-binding protein 1 n=2 Tax=Clastoptera arizonana TaxID=38151 RepID=A0A1B6CTB4_9HEMI
MSTQTRTIILKSPDSDNIREIIVTPVLFNKSHEGKLPMFNQMDCNLAERVGLNRKRRLEHLSLEEKILRKKLKNREAAQTSRDRKKARLDYLEETVKRLRQENQSLYDEVSTLKNDVKDLNRENTELRDEVWRLSVGGTPVRPTVSNPLQQGSTVPPALHLHLLLALLNFCLMSGTGLTRRQLNLTLTNLKSSQIHCLLNLLSLRCVKKNSFQWWGPTQNTWNPKKKKKLHLLPQVVTY